MGNNEYKNQSNNIYLPMFCRSSIKDIRIDNHLVMMKKQKSQRDEHEPSSPKVTCTGQVKRHNNRVTGFLPPISTAAAAVSHHHHHHHNKHPKLKKIFSVKTPVLPPTSSKIKNGSRSCRTSRDHNNMISVNNNSNLRRPRLRCDDAIDGGDDSRDSSAVIDVAEMDPPLPVVKKVVVGRDEVNIWKRRFNDEAAAAAVGLKLKSLQIEQIHLPNCKFQIPTTV